MIKKPEAVECVIYDCDGVLFDSLEANSRLYNHIATSMGRAELSSDELHYCHTHTVFESIDHLFRHDEGLAKDALEFLRERVDLTTFIGYLRMEPNVIEALQALKARNIRRAISTNRTTTMSRIMERFGLWPYFDMVVTALDVVRPKPNPEQVEKILDALQVRRSRTLYIGDSEVDKGTARASGVLFVAYKNPGLEADGAIDDHLSLLDCL